MIMRQRYYDSDVPVASEVTNVPIWEVAQKEEHTYSVTYAADQKITENGSSKTVQSAYEVFVYVDDAGNLVITKNPTITSIPVKSGYTPKAVENNGAVDSVTTEEIGSFLTTFFTLYPTATEKELSYYVNSGMLARSMYSRNWSIRSTTETEIRCVPSLR